MSITFQYRVRDSLGKIVDGQLDADGADEAAQQLRRQGFAVLELDERDDGGLFPRRVSKSEIVYMTSQLAVMVDTIKPLLLTQQALEIDDPSYPYSWID